MLQSPFRPLVPLSALALLGWCWYTFRKKRNRCESHKEELLVSSAPSMEENIAVGETSASGSTLAAQDVKTHRYFQLQEKQEGAQILDCQYSQLSTADDSSDVSGPSQATVLTSTPIVQHLKGIRPEPEGEVSIAQASLLLAEKPETEPEKEDDVVKGHLDFKAVETESFAQHPTGIVYPKEHYVTNVSENQNESGPSSSEADGPVVEVIIGATEEITPIGAGILERKGLAEPRVTPQSQVQPQKELGENKSLAVSLGAPTKTEEESVSSEHKLSDASSTFLTAKDSGCSTCLSDDSVEAEKVSSKSGAVEEASSAVPVALEIHHAVARKNGTLSRPKEETSKG